MWEALPQLPLANIAVPELTDLLVLAGPSFLEHTHTTFPHKNQCEDHKYLDIQEIAVLINSTRHPVHRDGRVGVIKGSPPPLNNLCIF